MRKGQPHPSSINSKNMLSQGLIELLQEKEYKDITITALCEHAQIARRTFYRNFETIGDVLAYYIACIIDAFVKELQVHVNDDYKSVVIAYFTFWEKNIELLVLLSKNNLTHIIFTQYIKSLHQFPVVLLQNSTEKEFACKLAYTSGGLWSVLTYWISNGCKQSPYELADIICNLGNLK